MEAKGRGIADGGIPPDPTPDRQKVRDSFGSRGGGARPLLNQPFAGMLRMLACDRVQETVKETVTEIGKETVTETRFFKKTRFLEVSGGFWRFLEASGGRRCIYLNWSIGLSG
ncbi:MAG: hypothetical protein Fur0025_43330 [Oscillatoriaceae cyanobacterium]